MSIRHCMLAMAIAATPIAAMCEPPKVYFGILSGANESPPTASPGTGYVLVTYDPDTSMMRKRPEQRSPGLAQDGTGTTASHFATLLRHLAQPECRRGNDDSEFRRLSA